MTAFRNVNLVPMTAEKIVENQTVLVKGDRIFKIGPADKVEIPPNSKLIDGEGDFLMPGLADMHVHLKGDWPISQLDMYLAKGVTTIRDLDGRDFMLQWRDDIKAAKRSGPTIYVSAPTIRGDENNPADQILTFNSGYDCIKLYSYLSKEDYSKVMETAKKNKLYTIGHIPFAVGMDGVIAAGMDEIAHIEELSFELIDFDRTKKLNPEGWLPYVIGKAIQQNNISAGFDLKKVTDNQKKRISAIIKRLKSTNVPVCTTLIVDDAIVQKLFEPESFLSRPQSTYLPETYKQAFLEGNEKHQVQFKGIEALAPFKYGLDKSLLIELHRAGIPLILGTDAGTGAMGIVPGFSIHDELRLLVENGLSPYDAIATGTVNAAMVAAAMTGKNEFGTIEEGKRADLILVDRNPLEDIAHIKDHRGVMAAGEWYERPFLEAAINPKLLPGIPIEGNVFQARRPDNSLNTQIEIVVGESFWGQLPDEIDSVTVTVTDYNGVRSTIPLPRHRYFNQFRDFWYQIEGPPAIGKYTFQVTSRGLNGTAVDFQIVNRAIPSPDSKTFWPANGEIITSQTPTFLWGPVVYSEGELYYRLVIHDLTGKRIYGTGRSQNMLSHTLPKGILKPGQTYQYKVRVMDSADWIEMQNRSESGWLTFKMSKVLDR
ncbi:MAG: amidohydrolase family protein [Desulfobacterales bacterium]